MTTEFQEELKNRFSNREQGIAFLYNNYGKKLYGYSISKWNVSEDEAWELVYKTLYKVIDVIDKYTFENEGKFAGFLFKIFINYLRNHYRDKKNKQFETVELKDHHGKNSGDKNSTDENKAPFNLALDCLKKALEKLQDWQRVLLLMRAQDFSYEQIATYIEKPTDQMKVYYMRLKKSVTEKTNDCVNGNINDR